MLLHRHVVALPIEGEIVLGGERLEQLGRHAIGLVELGRHCAVDGHAVVAPHLGEHPVDVVEPRVDRAEEVFLFLFDDARRRVGRFPQARDKGRFIISATLGTSLWRNGSRRPIWWPSSTARRRSRLTTYFSLLRAGIDVLVHGERAGADVVGDPPQPPAVVRFVVVLHAADFGRGQHDRVENVDVIVGGHALQRRGRALQAHAGVDVLRRQRAQVVRRIADAIELREHEVPDLDALAPLGMVVDFAARTADAVGALARGARRPEIFVLLAALDAIGREADVVRPDAGRFVVVFVDGDGEPSRLEAEPLLVGEKLPGPVDRVALEVVAEAEVAEHLEEGVVVGGAADVVDVARAETLLASRGAGELELHLAEEVVLELVHARGREQHGRIPGGHQHVARAAFVPLGLKESQVLFAQFVGLHEWGGFGSQGSGFRILFSVHARRLRLSDVPARSIETAQYTPSTPPTAGQQMAGCSSTNRFQRRSRVHYDAVGMQACPR